MDVTKLDVKSAADKGADLHLTHPATGDEIGVTIKVIGRDSPTVNEKMRELDRRKASGEEITDDQRGLELLAAVTVGWDGLEFDGKPLEFSVENARKVYADPRTEWIGEQVGPFALSRRNFARNYPKA